MTRLYVPIVEYQLTLTPSDTPTPTRTPTPTSTPTATATPTSTTIPMSNNPPAYSTSYYMRTTNPQTFYTLGCTKGKQDLKLAGAQDMVVVLDFGAPTNDGGVGADLFGLGPATTGQIAKAVEQFGFGYVACVGADTSSHLRIGIGTSNYGDEVNIDTGSGWGTMVNTVNAWFKSQGYFARVDAVGASDIELSWNDPDTTLNWLDFYNNHSDYAFYDYGDAAGCPTFVYPNWTCNPPWTQEYVWYVAFGSGSSYPLPLIYSEDGGNAQQWAMLSRWAYNNHHVRMDFKGAFTQWQACKQFPNGCGTGLDNTPAQGWQQLYNALKTKTYTAQSLPWSTDIMWQGIPFASSLALSAPQDEVSTLQSLLINGRPDAQARGSLLKKLAIARQVAAARLAGRNNPALQAAQRLPPPQSAPDAPMRSGIFPGDGGLFHAGQPVIINHWQSVVDGQNIQVYAGSTGETPAGGVVIVMVTSPDRTQTTSQLYPAPSGTGPLTITAENGLDLTLQAQNGQQFNFDLQTRQFSQ